MALVANTGDGAARTRRVHGIAGDSKVRTLTAPAIFGRCESGVRMLLLFDMR